MDDLQGSDKALTETGGLPTPEYPDEKQIHAYGAFTFLYLRSPRHQQRTLSTYRLFLQPAIDLRMFHIESVEGVPRAGITWALLGPDAEAKLVRGEMITPNEWLSGSQLWVMEIIAPYGQGMGAKLLKGFLKTVRPDYQSVRFVRYGEPGQFKYVTEYTRQSGGNWGKRRLSAADVCSPSTHEKVI